MPTESMSTKDAYMFPVIGSGTLFGLFLLFKYFNKEYVNMLLTAYFLFFGTASVTETLRPVMYFLFPAKRNFHIKFQLPYAAPVDIHWGLSDFLSFFIGIAVCAVYATTKHWVVNNILGFAFSVQGIALLSLGSYRNGAVLLAGLFFYDIFWVFGTDVMVSVAKSFDAPIKLVFPRNIFADEYVFSMLGLGDIVIPGFFVALLARFDKVMNNKGSPHFHTNYVAYVLGLLTTIGVMHTFKAAQPALLYLVPFCLVASFVSGIAQGQFGKLYNYEELPPAEKKRRKQEAKKAEKAKKE